MKVLRDSSFSFVPGRAHESVAEHDRILQLLEQRAPAIEIELTARKHRLATLHAVLEHQQQAKHRAEAPAA
jgi:hypothetical protein